MKKCGVLIIAILLSINQVIFAEETNEDNTTTEEVQVEEIVIPEEETLEPKEEETTEEEPQINETEVIEPEPQEEPIEEDTNTEETEAIESEDETVEEQPVLFARPNRPGSGDTTSSSVHHLDIRVNRVSVDVIDQNGNFVKTYEYASITNVHSAIITLNNGSTTTIPGSLFKTSSDGGTGDPEFDAEIESYGLTYDDIVSIEFIIDLKVSHDDITYENYTKLSFIMDNNELIKAKELCYNDNPNSFVHGYDFVFESPMKITVQETEDTETPEPDPIVPEEVTINLVPATGDISVYNQLFYSILSLLTLVKLNKKY